MKGWLRGRRSREGKEGGREVRQQSYEGIREGYGRRKKKVIFLVVQIPLLVEIN